MIDEFDRIAVSVLAPDIQETLGLSDAVLGAAAGASGVLFVLGAIPLGILADRFARTKVGGAATLGWAAIVFLTGWVTNAFTFFVARMGSGLGQSNVLPVQNSLAADAYPLGVRGRVFGLIASASPLGRAVGPLLAGGIAALAGGTEGWRWVFWVFSVPSLILGLIFLFTAEPERGRFDREALAAGLLADQETTPVSLGAAFDRLRAIGTFHYLLVGIGALGFALFSVPLFLSLLLEDRFGLDALDRGLVVALAQIPALILVPLSARRFDRVFRQSPPRGVLMMATLIAMFGVLSSIAVWMPNVALLTIVYAAASGLSAAGAATIFPIVAAVVPYRLRSQGFAIVGVYIFLLGAFGGAIITGLLSDADGPRTALTWWRPRRR